MQHNFLPKYLCVHGLACFCLFDLPSFFSIAGGELFERIIDDDYILTGSNQYQVYMIMSSIFLAKAVHIFNSVQCIKCISDRQKDIHNFTLHSLAKF